MNLSFACGRGYSIDTLQLVRQGDMSCSPCSYHLGVLIGPINTFDQRDTGTVFKLQLAALLLLDPLCMQ